MASWFNRLSIHKEIEKTPVERPPEPVERPPEPVEGGVTVIVCCHNSAEIIETTLEHLVKQEVEEGFKIEIILVDNGSVDNTSLVAQEKWLKLTPTRGGVPNLRVVAEPRPGLAFARFAGARAATFPYIIYCDDDNFLAPEYCRIAYELMQNDQSIGACGGEGIPVFQEPVPQWFEELGIRYAWGPQAPADGYVKSYALYGAGMVIRKSILMTLIETGYQPVLQDRVGKQLSSGGDEELTMWCKILGYQLYYSARLRFQHAIKAGRMTMEYVLRFYKAIGISLAHQIPLQVVLFNQENTFRARWDYQLIKWMVVGIKEFLFAKSALSRKLDFQSNYWRVKTILEERKKYFQNLHYLIGFKVQLKI